MTETRRDTADYEVELVNPFGESATEQVTDVEAVEFDGGAVIFFTDDSEDLPSAAYGPGQWRLVSRRD